MLKELRLCGKKIDIEKSPVLMSYQPDENFESGIVKTVDWYLKKIG